MSNKGKVQDTYQTLFDVEPLKEVEKEKGPKGIGPFDILDDITFSKKGILTKDNIHLYEPFFMNNGLSQHVDSLFYANEMNKRSDLPPYIQYRFLLDNVPKKRRMGKWVKGEDDRETVDVVKKHYNVSERVARMYMKNLTKEDIKQISELYRGSVTG